VVCRWIGWPWPIVTMFSVWPVCLGEPWPVDLALQNQDLVAKSEDLGIAGVAGNEDSSETCENKANQSRKQGQECGPGTQRGSVLFAINALEAPTPPIAPLS
jgi:hypothetical protein